MSKFSQNLNSKGKTVFLLTGLFCIFTAIGGRADDVSVMRPANYTKNLVARKTWLQAPASGFSSKAIDGCLRLTVEGKGKGMKWSLALPAEIAAKDFRYLKLRYRVTGAVGWSDYFVSLGDSAGNYRTLLSLKDAGQGGEWNTAVVSVPENFSARTLALQLSCASESAEAWIDYIEFSTTPLSRSAMESVSSLKGWDPKSHPDTHFKPVKLSGVDRDITSEHLTSFKINKWFPAGIVTVKGIPFFISDTNRSVVVSGTGDDRQAAVSIGEKGCETYFLMAAKIPERDYTHLSGTVPMYRFDNPERFVIDVEYADGTVDQMFPCRKDNGRQQILKGFNVYCLTGLENKVISRLRFKNYMSDAQFMVAGVTLNKGKRDVEEFPVAWLPDAVQEQESSASAGRIIQCPDGYIISSSRMSMKLRTSGGIAVESVANFCLQNETMSVAPGPLFVIGKRASALRDKSDKGALSIASDLVDTGIPELISENGASKLSVPFDGASRGVPLRGRIIFTVGDNPDIGINLKLTATGDKRFMPEVTFPVIKNLTLGNEKDTWYLWTRRCGIVNRDYTHQRQITGHYQLQVTDAFNPKAGGGMALFTRDLAPLMRVWDMVKNKNGITWTQDYLLYECEPGDKLEFAPVVLRAHGGDWRTAFNDYRKWVNTWKKPKPENRKWLNDIYYYQQTTVHDHIFNKDTGRWNTEDIVKRYNDFFGCLDYLHIFDFGKSEKFGRVGDYDHYDGLGGLQAMQDGIKRLRDSGTRVGLYYEGYLCDERCRWGRDNVLAATMVGSDGKPKIWGPNKFERYMCSSSKLWREHLSGVCGKTSNDLQPDGVYIDQYGHLRTPLACYSSEHGHEVPNSVTQGESATLSAIRSRIPDNVVILTEETPDDINAQYQDGALTYSVAHAHAGLSPSRIDFLRFAFPEFKQFQLVQYNKYNDGAWHKLKFPFFNGQGYWFHGGTDSWYCDEARQFLRKAFAILHKFSDCFSSNDIEPLVETLQPTVFANRFTNNGRTVWTVFNAEYRTYRGDVLRLPHREGAVYRDEFTDCALETRTEDGYDIIPVTLGPRGIGCISYSVE